MREYHLGVGGDRETAAGTLDHAKACDCLGILRGNSTQLHQGQWKRSLYCCPNKVGIFWQHQRPASFPALFPATPSVPFTPIAEEYRPPYETTHSQELTERGSGQGRTCTHP